MFIYSLPILLIFSKIFAILITLLVIDGHYEKNFLFNAGIAMSFNVLHKAKDIR